MEPRPTCERCLRPSSACYCHALRPVATKNAVLFLQHPREAGMPVGTARMAYLSLVGSELEVGVDFSASKLLARVLNDADRPAVLVYPGPEARDLEREPPHLPVRLIFIDGTWPEAKKIVRLNAPLRALPRYAFTPPAPSAYTIRREPRAEYLSTIESAAHVLALLEGDPTIRGALTAPFLAMVAQQVEFATTVRAARHRKRQLRPRAPRPVPPLLTERGADLVCVVAETNAWPEGSPERPVGDPGEVVHLVAERLATGEVFDAISPPSRVAPSTARYTELEPERLSEPPVDLSATWAHFIRPSDVLITWGTHTLTALEHASLTAPAARIDLRRTLRVYLQERAGTIEDFHARTNVAGGPSARGRAGRRVQMMGDLARWLTREPTRAR